MAGHKGTSPLSALSVSLSSLAVKGGSVKRYLGGISPLWSWVFVHTFATLGEMKTKRTTSFCPTCQVSTALSPSCHDHLK